MRDHLAELLFHVQTSVAFAILLFATQEDRHTWVSVITVSFLMIWILLSFSLLIHFSNYLLMRGSRSAVAVLGPIVIWAYVASARDVDFYYAGLLAPCWIAIGLNVFAIHDRKNTRNFRRCVSKYAVDLEAGGRLVPPGSSQLRTQDDEIY